MTNLLRKLDGLWNDKRAEFSKEVSQKEKIAIHVQMAKNEQVNDVSIF